MANIFLSENIIKYSKSTYTGDGRYGERNGYNAIMIQPNCFYKSSDEVKSSHILEEEFLPNTQYVMDMWIDGDDVIYNNNNVACGLTVHYSDGSTATNFVITGNHNTPLGFQHKILLTDKTKSVTYLTSYYYTSPIVYYRADSYICPLDEINLQKIGVLNIQNITESLSGTKDFEIVHGNISPTEIIEL